MILNNGETNQRDHGEGSRTCPHDPPQNLVHKGFGHAPFYLNYRYMKKGPYSYSGFDNPISIFNF